MMKIIIGIVILGAIFKIGYDRSNDDIIDFNETIDSLGQVIEIVDYGATMYMGTHENVEDLLTTIKSKYQGKAVILDLWGTFCKPCISDFKNSPAKKAQLKDLDVHMVYLCAGQSSNPNEWKKVVHREKLIGDHIYLDRKQTMEYRDKFSIKNYPNYILINKNGEYKQNIIRAVGDINIENFKVHL